MLDLINNVKDRELVMKEENKTKLLDMLRKFGNVVDYMTEPMVAKFYGVGGKCIDSYSNRNGDELSKYGYRVYKRNEILNLQLEGLENIPNRGLRLYPIEAVVVIGMMLTESKVAEELRSEIIKELFGVKTTEDDLVLAIYHSNDKIKTLDYTKQLVNLKVKEALKPIKEENERIKNENKHKQEVINALVYSVSLAEKRQRLNQIITHGENIVDRWRYLYGEFNMKYHKDVYRCARNRDIRPIDYIDKELKMIDELYALAVKLFESDVDNLLELWEKAIKNRKEM